MADMPSALVDITSRTRQPLSFSPGIATCLVQLHDSASMSVNVCGCVHECPQWMSPIPPSPRPCHLHCPVVPVWSGAAQPQGRDGGRVSHGHVYGAPPLSDPGPGQHPGWVFICTLLSVLLSLSSLTWKGLECHVWKAHHSSFSSQPRMWGGEGWKSASLKQKRTAYVRT